MSANNANHYSKSGYVPHISSLKFAVLAGVAVFMALAGASAHAEPILFSVNWKCTAATCTDAENSAASALQYAANIWGSLINRNYVGETITIDAFFDDSMPAGALGGASPVRAEYSGVPIAEYYFYPSATANHLALGDLYPGEPEIEIKYSPTSNWFYDTSNPSSMAADQYDFATISLHEIAHGLGFVSALSDSMQYPFTLPADSPCPGCGTGWYFDGYVYNIDKEKFPISVPPDQRLALVTDPYNLVFTGGFAKEANGGEYPILWTPPVFLEGSSISHLSELYFPDDLMLYSANLGKFNHTPSELDLAILKDVGWVSYAIPEPGSFLLLVTGTGMLCIMLSGRKKK